MEDKGIKMKINNIRLYDGITNPIIEPGWVLDYKRKGFLIWFEVENDFII